MTTQLRFRIGVLSATLIILATVVTVMAVTAIADQGDTTRVSVDSSDNEGNSSSFSASVTANGRYVAFDSFASNLVANDTNSANDVFVHDRDTGVTERVSVDDTGNQGNNNSSSPSVSANGRYVAFASAASNLVANDTNNVTDVFVHDRDTGVTERVSVDDTGNQGNNSSTSPSVSANGRYVAFYSFASNLVTNDTNNAFDVFVHDRDTRVTKRVSVDDTGNQGNNNSSSPSVSANGRYVTFDSGASNLVANDTNNLTDVFVHDRDTGVTERVSVDGTGNQGNNNSSRPSVSANGRYVTFDSGASNLVANDTNNAGDVFVHDRDTGVTERVSGTGTQGNSGSLRPSVSADGRYVAFYSLASNLVANDTNNMSDVFVHDRDTGNTTRVSVNNNGNQGNSGSLRPSISADGRYVGFQSDATNLVSGDTNSATDVFVHQYLPDPPPPTTTTSTSSSTTSSTTTSTTTMPPSDRDHFTDDDGHLFEDDINAIAGAGITRGCNPPDNDHYCPDESFLRGQAAAFMRRALGVPASDTDHFTDDESSVFEEDINAIATEGITLGCNPPDNTQFCPTDPFTRGQAAAFVRRALNVPATDTDHFTDDDTSVFEVDINAIAEAGITRGCNPPDNDRYCPDELLTRGQAAAFMRRALLP